MSKVTKQALALVKRLKRYPSFLELEAVGVTRAQVRQEFGTLRGLNIFLSKNSTDIFDLERSKVVTAMPKTKRFVVTTAVTNSPVHKGFLISIKNYCRKEKAGLIILPTKKDTQSPWSLDPILRNESILIDDVSLNSNIFLLGVKSTAKQTDPVTGLPRVGKRNGTFVMASPKQRLKYVATGINKLPHALMSTGAITVPNYVTGGLLANKQDYLANSDHVMGAIIIELDDKDVFHFRQIQADAHGAFADLGTLYSGMRTKDYAPEAVVLGDWHSGDTDPAVAAALTDLTKKIKPKRWVLHDIFDGLSVNPHTLGKGIVRAKLAEAGRLFLEDELKQLKNDICMMSKLVDKVVIVRSNHDDFLDRYLDNADYVGDDHNHKMALTLAVSALNGKNPLEEYVGPIKNVTWLKTDESLKIAGVECGMHGHLGGNGTRGSIVQMETAYGNVMFGHSHTPGILRDSWNVGTSTFLQLGYNKGASSWMQCSGIVYANGQKQLINFIDGKFTTKKL